MEMGSTIIRLGWGESAFTLVALLVGFLMYLYAPYWGVRKVPGPPTIPLLGHLPLLAKHGPDVFSVLAQTYGPVFRCRHQKVQEHPQSKPAFSHLWISSPPEGPFLHKVVVDQQPPSKLFRRHHRDTKKELLNCLDCRDSRWSAMRNTIISLYQPTHLAGLIPTVQSYIDSATRHLSSTQNDDVTFSDLSLRLATDVIGEAAFGVDFGLSGGSPPDGERSKDGEVSEFIKEHVYSTTSLKMDLSGSFSIVLGLIVPVLQEPVRQLLKRIPGTVDWKIHRTNLNLSKRLEEIVAKRASERDRGSKDFLSAILNARDSDGASRKLFTSDYISALTYEHLLAGSATTSFTLSSVLYLVSNHPEVEQKLVQEIDGFGPIDLIPTADDLQHEFPYLDQVSPPQTGTSLLAHSFMLDHSLETCN
ncbi:hypothetical protein BHE74_00005487 [Ensete ventricosum]|nr:hypothetical protein BHE74_00005487 [Ensete ventricosum]